VRSEARISDYGRHVERQERTAGHPEASLRLNAFDKDHVRSGGAVAHLARLAVFLAIEPLFGAVRRFEFKHNDALWVPIAFQCLSLAATHDVFPAIFLHRRVGELLIFLIADRIDNVDFDDHVRGHRSERSQRSEMNVGGVITHRQPKSFVSSRCDGEFWTAHDILRS